jgi:hypothetical protein
MTTLKLVKSLLKSSQSFHRKHYSRRRYSRKLYNSPAVERLEDRTMLSGVTGVDVSYAGPFSVSDDYMAYVSNELQLNQDVNGDQLISSVPVVVRYEFATGNSTPLVAGFYPSISDEGLAFASTEKYLNLDFDGDGDFDGNTSVVGYYNFADDQISLLDHYRSGEVFLSGDIVAYTSSETSLQQDFNGDGVLRSNTPVAAYHDMKSGKTTGIEVGLSADVLDNRVAFYTYESWVGQDIDGDGDIDTSLPFPAYHDLRTNNTTFVPEVMGAAIDGFHSISISEEYLAFVSQTGAAYYDIAAGTTTEAAPMHIPVASNFVYTPAVSISGDRIAYVGNELQLNEDVDGDGMMGLWERVAMVYDIKTGESTVLASASILSSGSIAISSERVVFASNEVILNQDYDGDGISIWDAVASFVMLPPGPGAAIDGIIDDVNELDLSAGQKAGLIAQLEAIQFKLENDHEQGAYAQISGLILELEAKIKNGQLEAVEGDALILDLSDILPSLLASDLELLWD